jgi:hypothetical protein
VLHASGGRPSNRKCAEAVERQDMEILRQEVYRGLD